MKIDREHIEQLFFEYFEGNLSSSEEKELLAFLKHNPDLYEDFNLYKSLKLSPSDVYYTKKDLLKKNVPGISDDEFETLCIRFVENDLSRTEETKLKQYIKSNPEKERILNLYLKTKLLPDISENYSQKQHLKKSVEKVNEQVEQLFIAYAEGVLSVDEKQKLTNYLKSHPEKEKELQLYQKTKLSPDTLITYPNKSELKKTFSYSKRTTIRLYWSLSAAASIAIAMIFAFNFSTKKNYYGKNLASVVVKENPINKKVVSVKLPVVKRAIYKNSVKLKKQETPIIQKENILPAHDITNSNYVQQEIKQNDTVTKVIQPVNQTKQPLVAETKVSSNEKLTKEGLDQLFADSRFHYFHDMMNDMEKEKQAYLPNHNGSSLWSVLESGSKTLSKLTGSNIVVKEKENEESRRVKQYVKIGSFSFSRTFSRK